MGKKKVHQRLSPDALELLEYIDADGPFDSTDELRKYTGDGKDRWKPTRVATAVEELIATERVARDRGGRLRSVQTGDYALVTTGDDELGVRVCVVIKVYAADESIDWAVIEDVRAQSDMASELGDLVVEKLRRANGLSRIVRLAAAMKVEDP